MWTCGSWMRSSMCVVPEVAMRLATFSIVIWLSTPSCTKTRTPPGNHGALMAAASRCAIPSNMACIGARTAILSCLAEQPLSKPTVKQTITVCRQDRIGTLLQRSVAETCPEKAAFRLLPQSEDQLQSELHFSWVEGTRDHSEIRRSENPTRQSEVRMIERVVRVHPKLQIDRFPQRPIFL